MTHSTNTLKFDSKRCPGAVVIFDTKDGASRELIGSIFKLRAGPNTGKHFALYIGDDSDIKNKVSEIFPDVYPAVKQAFIKACTLTH